MHFDERIPADPAPKAGGWTKELNRYHWFVLIVAALGWMFDTMDQQLFNLARKPAVTELLTTSSGQAPSFPARCRSYGGVLDDDLHARLGDRRSVLRRPGRSDRPGQDDAHDPGSTRPSPG